jgi:phosphoesterase RecJ-like protein
MIDETQWTRAASRVEAWRNIIILTHARPDGDALGAIAALKRIFEARGKRAAACVYEDVPKRYAFLQAEHDFMRFEEAARDASIDGIVIVDTCSWSQLEPAADWLRQSTTPRLVIDHHNTRDDVAGAGEDVLYLIDERAASACGLIYRWCQVMGWPVDRPSAEALYVGMATDTGWFRFSNTDAETMQLAAMAIAAGVRADRLYCLIYESRSPQRLPLLGEVLSTLEYHLDHKLAVMWVTPDMFEFTGAKPTDTEEFVNVPLEGAGVIVSIFLTDQGQGPIRVNFRSKSPEVCGLDVDVSELAAGFDGGGHRRAAGARVDGDLGTVRDQVIGEAIRVIEKTH